jgi:ferredoxin
MFGSKEAVVQFDTGQRIVTEGGTSILQVAIENNIEIEHYCDGSCSCSTCRVEIIKGGQNLSKMKENETAILGEKRVAKGDRLACQAQINGEVHVRIPDMF